MKNILLVIFLFAAASCFAQSSLNIIPQPAKVQVKEGSFNIKHSSIFYSQKGVEKSATFLNNYLQEYYDFKLPVVKKEMYPENKISLH